MFISVIYAAELKNDFKWNNKSSILMLIMPLACLIIPNVGFMVLEMYEACICTNLAFVLFMVCISIIAQSCCLGSDNDNVKEFKLFESVFLFILLITICSGLFINCNIIQTGEIDINSSDLIFTIFWFHIVSHVCKEEYGILTIFGKNSKVKHKMVGIICIIAVYLFSLGIVAWESKKVYFEIFSNILIGTVSLSIMYGKTKAKLVSLILILAFLGYVAIGITCIVDLKTKEHLEEHLALVELLLSMVLTGFGLILENFEPSHDYSPIPQ